MDEIMTENTRDIMLEFVSKVLNFAESSVNFAQEQIPDVIEQLITFYVWSYSFYMTLCVVFIITALIMWRKLTKAYAQVKNGESNMFYNNIHDINPEGVITYICVIGTLIVCPLILLFNIPELIKLVVAPKVWLIEYAADLMRSRVN